MDSDEKKAHERARRRALAIEAGLDPGPEDAGEPPAKEPPPSVNQIISRLTSDNREWRDQCTALLVQRGAEAVPALLGAMRHASPLVRYHATAALGAIGDARAIPALVEALADLEENRGGVAAGAEVALAKFGPAAVPLLLTAAEQGADTVRTRAVRLLGRIQSAVPDEVLRRLLHDGSENVRIQAATALWQVAGARAVDDLIGAAKDDSRWVRCAAAEALANLRRPEARPILEAVLADPEDFHEARWAEELLELL
ncbi:MAG TPA: HEAT repeat domain-containing protein [Myxococcales bacterium]|nr:HEAT repeat domain-containing protein [Myxococcales bacterium]